MLAKRLDKVEKFEIIPSQIKPVEMFDKRLDKVEKIEMIPPQMKPVEIK